MRGGPRTEPEGTPDVSICEGFEVDEELSDKYTAKTET